MALVAGESFAQPTIIADEHFASFFFARQESHDLVSSVVVGGDMAAGGAVVKPGGTHSALCSDQAEALVALPA